MQGFHAVAPSALRVFRTVLASSALRVHVFGECQSGNRAAMASHRGLLCCLSALLRGSSRTRWRPEALPGLPWQRGHRDLQPPFPSFPRVTARRVRAHVGVLLAKPMHHHWHGDLCHPAHTCCSGTTSSSCCSAFTLLLCLPCCRMFLVMPAAEDS